MKKTISHTGFTERVHLMCKLAFFKTPGSPRRYDG